MRGMIWDEWPHIRYFGSFIILLELRESSFNMTRGRDEDIETRSLKF